MGRRDRERAGADKIMPPNKANLKPKTSPQARGKLGGIKSAQVKKERKMLSAMYAEFLAKEHNVVVEGKSTKVSGHILADRVIAKVLSRGDSSSVRLLREMREATEGSKVQMTGAGGAPLIPQAVVFKVVDAHDSQGRDCETVPGDS